jgi:hypothetical protein
MVLKFIKYYYFIQTIGSRKINDSYLFESTIKMLYIFPIYISQLFAVTINQLCFFA